MSAPEGVALIGSGIFAREAHLPAILATPSLSLKAVYSRSLKSIATLCEGLAQKIDWYSEETNVDGRGLQDMLSNTNIKGVIIALPITKQPEFIRASLKAGKHVLSEKPIAKDLAQAEELIKWYRHSGEVDTNRVRWCVAENWRFTEPLKFAAEELPKLGRILHFSFRASSMVKGGKYFETEWRKKPEYQGGFLLDAGVHHAAGLRLLLGTQTSLQRVSAFSCQLQEHLPPVDTINATMLTKGGASGTFANSVGTTFARDMGYAIACEGGSMVVKPYNTISTVVVTPNDGAEISRDFANPTGGPGVEAEIGAWADGVVNGNFVGALEPEQALGDLELMEAIFRSGERDGTPVDLKFQ